MFLGDPKPVHIHLTWVCGHVTEFDSPSVRDPAGVFAEAAGHNLFDGTAYCSDFYPCEECRKINHA